MKDFDIESLSDFDGKMANALFTVDLDRKGFPLMRPFAWKR
jgi:hypothetical protein